MTTQTQFGLFMGFDMVLEFDLDVHSYGAAQDPWGDDPGAGPDFYVNGCKMWIDNPDEPNAPKMNVAGEMLRVLEEKFHDKIARDLVDNAAEEYWTEKWSCHDA